MDIVISGYPVPLRVGCLASERVAGQEVLVSLVLTVSDALGAQDDLSTTLSYAEVVACVDELVSGKEMQLIETAINLLGKGLLQRFSAIERLHIELEKPIIPLGISKGAKISLRRDFLRH